MAKSEERTEEKVTKIGDVMYAVSSERVTCPFCKGTEKLDRTIFIPAVLQGNVKCVCNGGWFFAPYRVVEGKVAEIILRETAEGVQKKYVMDFGQRNEERDERLYSNKKDAEGLAAELNDQYDKLEVVLRA